MPVDQKADEGKRNRNRVVLIYANPETHRTGHHSPDTVLETTALKDVGADVTILTISGLRTGKPSARQVSLSSPWLTRFMDRSGSSNAFAFFIVAAMAFWKKRALKANVLLFRDFEPHTWMPHLFGIFNRGASFVIVVALDPTKFLNRPLVTRLYVFLCKLSIRRNHFAYVAIGKRAKEVYSRIGNGVLSGRLTFVPLPCRTVKPGVTKPEARMKLGLPLDQNVFLSLGVTKDRSTLLKAFSNIDNAVLLIAGRDDSLNGAVPSRLPPQIIFKRGFVDEEEMPLYYAASDASILAYDRNFYHGSGGLRTACGYGLPVIASDIGEVGPTVKDHRIGLLFEPESPSSLFKALVEYMRLDNSQIQNLKENCMNYAQETSSESWARKLMKLFELLLSRDNNRQLGAKVTRADLRQTKQ